MTPSSATQRAQIVHLLVLLVLAIVVLFFNAHTKELHGTAVFYASLVREIIDSGDWLGIYTDERAYLLKPPLAVWLSALASQVFGLSNLGVTFVSRAAGVVCVLLCYALFKRWWGHPIAWIAALSLLTNSTFVQFSATFRMDALLLMGLLMSLVGWVYLERKWATPLLFAGITVAVLSKGPLGFAAIPLIVVHATLVGKNPLKNDALVWVPLLLPMAAWYGFLYLSHGADPFTQLGADALRATATPDLDRAQSAIAEYVLKPMRRYWPWLPFILAGAAICLWRIFSPQPTSFSRRHHFWLLLWLGVTLIGAVVKPDHDIRYLYPALPVLGLFCGIAVMALPIYRFPQWAPAALISVFVGVIVIYQLTAKPRDTRPAIAAINAQLSTSHEALAIGGFPVRLDQPRRQNTHRDWIHFYTGRSPNVLSWSQVRDRNPDFTNGVFLTNSRGHRQHLEEFGLVAHTTTDEMIFALPK